MRSKKWQSLLIGALMSAPLFAQSGDIPLSYGTRPFYLIDNLEEGALKEKLLSCQMQAPEKSDFSIAHRGAALFFPEHTYDSYMAAARSGAGIIECDVAFTKDKELVCRHAQDDLATTTNILVTPLAEKCTQGFSPAEFDQEGNLIKEASALCLTSDITLAEFKTLKGKMDGYNPKARTVEEYMQGTPNFRTDLYTQNGKLLTHKESIELFKKLGVKMTPELKDPAVAMPFDGFTMEDYAQKMIDEYIEAGVPPEDVFPQSFNPKVISYWLQATPEFGKQAVFLDEELDTQARIEEMPKLRAQGLNYIAPALPMLLRVENGELTISDYAKTANAEGLKIIAWTIERDGPLTHGGGWYHSGLEEVINNDGNIYDVLHILSQDAKIVGIFSDWPATVTYYANCFEK